MMMMKHISCGRLCWNIVYICSGLPGTFWTTFILQACIFGYIWVALLTVFQVTWYSPVANDTGCQLRRPHLTKVTRNQRFLTYLAMFSADLPPSSLLSESRHLHVLKAVSWSVEVTINVDPTRPVGERVTFIGPARQHDPEIIDGADAPNLTENALHPPNANSSQVLVWWPASGNEEPVVVVRPVMTTPSIIKAMHSYQHSNSRHALRLQSLYHFSAKHWHLSHCVIKSAFKAF